VARRLVAKGGKVATEARAGLNAEKAMVIAWRRDANDLRFLPVRVECWVKFRAAPTAEKDIERIRLDGVWAQRGLILMGGYPLFETAQGLPTEDPR